MTTRHLTRNASPRSNVLTFERPETGADAGYDWALAKQETRLRDALAKVRASRRRHDEATQRSEGILRALFTTRDAASSRIASLTPRQREIMDLVLDGYLNKTIAREIGINQRTVESHRAAIMKKTGAASLPELARLAVAAAWDGVDESFVQFSAPVAVAPFGADRVNSRSSVVR